MQAASNAGAHPFDIFIVGTGMAGPRQVTPEVAAALRSATEVFYVDSNLGIAEALGTLCNRVTSLAGAYEEGLDRRQTYRRMSARIFSAAIERPPVALALYGHPLVFALPPFHLMALAKIYNLRVKVLPGVSSLDTMFVDLNLDPAANGLQIYEATDVLLRRRPLQPDVACFLLQIGTLASSIFSLAPNAPQRFRPIKEYLLGYYPPSHVVHGVTSSGHPLVDPAIVTFELQAMEEHAAELDYGVTLYIPPVSVRPIIDRALLAGMASPEHLQTLVAPPS